MPLPGLRQWVAASNGRRVDSILFSRRLGGDVTEFVYISNHVLKPSAR